MSKYIITTVATHEDGMFKKLINNKFQKIKVLGFGMEWKGFKMKYSLLYNFIKDLDENTIIIFLDGFDSAILRNPDIAIKKFKERKYKVLFSKEVDSKFKSIVFPNCRNNIMINSGLYMGYVKYLKIILKDMIEEVCKDDQVVVNRKCKDYSFISIDTEQTIFKNIGKLENLKPGNAIFIQYPGMISISRYFRGIKEYGQFFLNYFFYLNLGLGYYFCKINKHHYLYYQLVLSILFIKYIDTSCIEK